MSLDINDFKQAFEYLPLDNYHLNGRLKKKTEKVFLLENGWVVPKDIEATFIDFLILMVCVYSVKDNSIILLFNFFNDVMDEINVSFNEELDLID